MNSLFAFLLIVPRMRVCLFLTLSMLGENGCTFCPPMEYEALNMEELGASFCALGEASSGCGASISLLALG